MDIAELLANFNISKTGTNQAKLIKCPILSIHGSDDFIISLKDVEDSAKEFGENYELKII